MAKSHVANSTGPDPVDDASGLSGFLNHLEATVDSDLIELCPEFCFWAKGLRALKPHTLANAMPGGTVMLLPDYLIFLTDQTGSPGLKFLFKQLGKELYQTARLIAKINHWMANHTAAAVALVKWILSSHVAHDPEYLAKLMGNPNSFFVPTSEIEAVNFYPGRVQGHHIQVILKDGSGAVIEQDIRAENQFKALIKQFTANWNVKFQRRLREIAEDNAAAAESK